METKPGRIIVFEGTDGCGKGTQVAKLAEWYSSRNHTFIQLREPGGTVVGEQVRDILKHSTEKLTPITELLLMNACRSQLVETVIEPAIKEGKDVILDRFFYSTIAYQGFGRQIPLQVVNQIVRAAVGELKPDFVFLLRLSPEKSRARQKAREASLPFKREATDRFEAEKEEFFHRVSQGYESIAKDNPKLVHVLDASETVDNIHQKIISILCI
jgi:dTMP kinase